MGVFGISFYKLGFSNLGVLGTLGLFLHRNGFSLPPIGFLYLDTLGIFDTILSYKDFRLDVILYVH